MIPSTSLPHRLTIIAKAPATDAGERYGNREPVEVRRYEQVPARVDDVSTTEDVVDRARTDTFYDVILRARHRGVAVVFDALAEVVWHRGGPDGEDIALELDGTPAHLDGLAAQRDHLELRARRVTG